MPHPEIPVTIKTPDGVERELRYTFGAQKRIADLLGCKGVYDALQKYGDGALPDMLYACMFDEEGEVPKMKDGRAPLSLAGLREQLDPDQGPEFFAALMIAATRGKVKQSKNELAGMLRKAMEESQESLLAKVTATLASIGSNSGASPASSSASLSANSGTAPSENLTPSSDKLPSEQAAA